MGLLETLIIGSYLYTTAFGSFLYRKLVANHLKHLEGRIKALEDRKH